MATRTARGRTPCMKFQLTAAVGVNDQEDDVAAVEWAVMEAKIKYGEGENAPQIALVHMTADRDVDLVLKEMRSQLGEDVRVIGATTCNGVLHPSGSVLGGMSVMLLGGSDDAFRCGAGSFEDGDVIDVSEKVASSLGDDIELVVVMPTPGVEEDVIRGIKKALGDDVKIFGGSAADNTVSGDWRVYQDLDSYGSGVAMLGIRKKRGLRMGTWLHGPYTASNTLGKVTKSEGRTIHTLDDKPAADALYRFEGEGIEDAYRNGGDVLAPMSVRPYGLQRVRKYTRSDGEEVTETTTLPVHIASINQPDGSVSLFAEAREGDELRKMSHVARPNPNVPEWARNVQKTPEIDPETGNITPQAAAGDAIRYSYERACAQNDVKPVACLMVYCGGMAMAVGEKGLEKNCVLDLQQIEGLPWHSTIGFTAFGEQHAGDHFNISVGMLVLE